MLRGVLPCVFDGGESKRGVKYGDTRVQGVEIRPFAIFVKDNVARLGFTGESRTVLQGGEVSVPGVHVSEEHERAGDGHGVGADVHKDLLPVQLCVENAAVNFILGAAGQLCAAGLMAVR